MTTQRLIKTFLRRLLYILIALSLTTCKSDKTELPNIVLIFIDDMGWGDFSCFGNQATTTPNIDRLAARGTRFSQAYVQSPICVANRMSF